MARGLSLIGASIALLAVAACNDHTSGAKTEASSEQRIAAALDTCAEARNGFAQNLCENRALSTLDNQIRSTLVAEAANVSDAGAQMLVQNQRRWRDAQRVLCGIADPAAEPDAEQQRCLEERFSARAHDVATTVQELGAYTFQRMELVEALPVTDAQVAASGLGDEAPPAVVREISFPRIDGQQTPQIQRFNELVAQQPQYQLGDGVNEIVEYQIAYAGPDIISVRFNVSEDQLGSAHPNNSFRAVTVMMDEGRPLTETDVFKPDSRWQDFITRRAVADITQQFREEGFTPPERDVRETAIKPHLWLITERGLVILFPPYSFGPYALGGAEVTIPWRDLAPYLNPAAVAPIRPSA
ncbi:RsiV family protein [Terricaulis sp.]|uniref:RsiV family protein n=1 Tax=Terricaulis sp. TaxID=2768686 RepID=UPI0037846072